MGESTKAYMIELSEKSRYILDSEATELSRLRQVEMYGIYDPTTTRRASLRHYFHKDYIDNRPDWLVKARAWSVNERKFKTMVSLTDEQVAQVLQLSIDMDIDPRPNATRIMNPSSRGITRYLLGTFLEAVLAKHLVRKVDNAS